MPDEQYEAELSKRRGKVAGAIKDPKAKRKFIARQGEGKASKEELETETARVRDQGALTGFKRGGRVKRTGIYKVHKGEKVLPVKFRGTKLSPAKTRGKRIGGKAR